MATNSFWQFFSYIKESQTFLGLFQFTVTIIPWSFIIGYAIDYYSNDRLQFKCEAASDVAIRLCYEKYDEGLNPLLSSLAFIIVIGVVPLVLWVLFGIGIVVKLSSPYEESRLNSRRAESEVTPLLENGQQQPELQLGLEKPKSLYKVYQLHILLRFASLLVGLILFLHYQKRDIPSEFHCSLQGRHTQFNCTDFRSTEKSEINNAVLAVNGVLSVLAMLEFCYLCYTTWKYSWGRSPTDKEFSSFLKGTPGPPSNLGVQSRTVNRIELAWNTPIDYGGSGIRRYHVRTRGKDALEEVNCTTTSVEFAGLRSGETYYFEVAAENQTGIGPSSSMIQEATINVDKSNDWLKRWYIERLKIIGMFTETNSSNVVQERDEIFVDLTITETKKVEEKWKNCDIEYHLRTYSDYEQKIAASEVLLNENRCVLLCGIAGIGKTFILDTFVLHWAKNEIWVGQGGQPDAKYVFMFKCRDLNQFDELSVRELFERQYRNVRETAVFECVLNSSRQSEDMVLILDGLDEFKDLDTFCSCTYIEYPTNLNEKCKTGILLCYIFDTVNGLCPGHKSILAGRPESIDTVHRWYLKRALPEIKSINIVGFNSRGIEEYIKKFSVDKSLEETINNKIKESFSLKAMSSVPVYLWIICSMFKTDPDVDPPDTITELYIRAFGLYLREHFKKRSDLCSKTLPELFRVEEVKRVLDIIPLLAYTMIIRKKVVFTRTDLTTNGIDETLLLQVRESGFIVKAESDFGTFYQFRHFTLQEFFAAMYFFRNGDDLSKLEISEMIPILAGLEGGSVKDSKSPVIVKLFAESLHRNVEPSNVLNKIVTEISILSSTESPSKKLIDVWMDLYLSCVYEYKNISQEVIQKHIDHLPHVYEREHLYPHQLKHVLDFVTNTSEKNAFKFVSLPSSSAHYMLNWEMALLSTTIQKRFRNLLRIGYCDRMEVWAWERSSDIVNKVKDALPLKANCNLFLQCFVFGYLRDPLRCKEDCACKDRSKAITRFVVKSDVRWESIKFINLDWTDSHLSQLTECFTGKHIKRVTIMNCNLSDTACNSLTKLIFGMQHLEELDLSQCKLQEKHLEELAEIIPCLKSVDLSSNPHKGVKGYQVLRKSICDASHKKRLLLQSLNLSCCHLELEQLKVVIYIVPFIKHINLHDINGNLCNCDYFCSSVVWSNFGDTFVKTVLKAARFGNGNQFRLKTIILREYSLNENQVNNLKRTIPYLDVDFI